MLGSQSFYVRPNLWAALKALRSTTKERILWIDALCINEEDIQERNHQVAIMHAIYSSAERVLVWLGNAADSSDVYFQYVNSERCLQSTSASKMFLAAKKSLCKRSYWGRAWIRQEILLAKDIILYCGNEETSWDNSFDFVFPFDGRVTEFNPERIGAMAVQSNIWTVYSYRKGGTPKKPLFNILSQLGTAQHCQCSDTRDRIFSVLSLAEDYRADEIADYSANTCTLSLGLLEYDIARRHHNRLYTYGRQGFADTLRWVLDIDPPAISRT